LRYPETNTFVAMRPVEGVRRDALRADISLVGSPEWSGGTLTAVVRATNEGSVTWRPGLVRGSTTVAPYLPEGETGRTELPRVLLTTPVRPGESIDVQIALTRDDLRGGDEFRVDVVCEQISWLGDLEGTPLVVTLPS
jgi:hypothetical protein